MQYRPVVLYNSFCKCSNPGRVPLYGFSLIKWLFPVYVEVVPIPNYGDPKRPKGLTKIIGGYTHFNA